MDDNLKKDIERLVKIINERGEIRIDELAGEFGKSIKEVKKLLKILKKHKVVEVKKRLFRPDVVRSLVTFELKKATAQKKLEEKAKKEISKIEEIGKEIKTEADKIVEYVIAYEKIKLSKLANLIGDSIENVEKLAKILDQHNIIRLVYPENPFAEPYLEKVKE